MRDLTSIIADLSDAGLSPEMIQRPHLLEASAGTGKTYSIQTLYLRLVLVEGLTVQQILVVTFTRDATQELRDRLQKVLREALDYLEDPATIRAPEDRTKKIVDAAAAIETDPATARQRLRLALLDFDLAAIFTIHGFCRRILNQFAFETGQAFDVEPAGESGEEIETLCKDWWRRNLYHMDESLAGLLSESGSFTFKAIAKLASRLIAKPDAVLDCETGSDKIEATIKARLVEFINGNHPTAAETADYPAARPEIQDVVTLLQKMLKTFRGLVACGPEKRALDFLLSAVRYSQVVATSCAAQAAILKTACDQFITQVPKGTHATTFHFNEAGCLCSGSCPDLSDDHTTALAAAAREIDLPAAIEQYAPFSLRKNASFESYQLVVARFRCFEDVSAKALFSAIKEIAKSKDSGMVREVTCTVDAINPGIRKFYISLYQDCAKVVCQAGVEIKTSYQQSRSAATTASYNDFLVDLRHALEGNDLLRSVLREQFRAALIDEFQDTDPIQWGIFEKLFKDAGMPCFLVGDPKQAIYRFRNGDIETYLKATQGMPDEARHPLNRNFRSEARLIDAVNQVFLDPDKDHPTFGSGIYYREPLAAKGKIPDESLCINGKPDNTPFKILLIASRSKGSRLPGKNSPSAVRAYKLTAREIAGILADPNQTIGGRRIAKKDIAVLVGKHDEAGHIARELKALDIPSVRQGTGNVWLTDEGRTLWVMLEAVLDARNLSNVRNALLSPWCGLSPEQIRTLNDGQRIPLPGHGEGEAYGLDDWVACFGELRETWVKRGYPAMFRQLTAICGVKTRLLALEDRQGQRRLANIGHLSEWVERKIIQDRKTPEGLLAWVRRQFDRDTADGGEETKLRLETDDAAVRIMTVFTSKGLEFPVVFAPTLFMLAPFQRGGLYEYHDGEGNLHIAGKTGNDQAENGPKDAERDEMTREHVRQIYVALTRAVHRSVVIALNEGTVAGKSKKGEEPQYRMRGVLGEVLRLPMGPIEVEVEGGVQQRIVVDMDRVRARFENIPDVACAVDVRAEGETDGDASRKPGQDVHAQISPARPMLTLHPPPARPKIDTSKGHGSFTSLAPREGETERAAAPAVSSGEIAKNRDGETAPPDGLEPAAQPEGIFAFPAGARTGTCWHEMFEELPFGAGDDAIRARVAQKLQIHGFLRQESSREDRIQVTTAMVRNVLRVQLPAPGDMNGFKPFALASVQDADRKTEWEFSFATLPGKHVRELRATISSCETYRPFTDALGAWDREIPGGYLTGFVDLLFRKEKRYYIADWKSNRRNGTQQDFTPAGLRAEISMHRYWLQYLVYTVAVHQYLARAMPDYCYETHFGGVYYIFLRGVDGGTTNGHVHGVHADRPPVGLVNALSNILGDFS